MQKTAPDALRGGDAQQNAAIARAILSGQRGAPRDIVLLNAGASLLIAGHENRLEDGIRRAGEAIDSGRAAAVLDALIALSQGKTEGRPARSGQAAAS